MIETSDISFVLSGGSANTVAADSLGGEPSVTTVPARLFADVSADESEEGATHYRCIYIANDHASETLYHATLHIADEVADGASASLGFIIQDEIQQVVVANGTTVSSGSLILLYDGDDFTVTYNATLSTWASNFQTAIQAVSNLDDVTVTASTSGTTVIFEIVFGGTAGNRYHPVLEIDSNTLSPSALGTVFKITDGGPINTVAPEIDSETTPPNGIVFYTPTEDEPLELGEFRPEDMIPVWIKRTCPVDTDAVADDGFTLQLEGEPIE